MIQIVLQYFWNVQTIYGAHFVFRGKELP